MAVSVVVLGAGSTDWGQENEYLQVVGESEGSLVLYSFVSNEQVTRAQNRLALVGVVMKSDDNFVVFSVYV